MIQLIKETAPFPIGAGSFIGAAYGIFSGGGAKVVVLSAIKGAAVGVGVYGGLLVVSTALVVAFVSSSNFSPSSALLASRSPFENGPMVKR